MEGKDKKLTIGYEFDFWLAVRKRNGKLYRNHHIVGLGITFGFALWDVYHTLKKRKSQIVAIHNVRPLCIAFAFDENNQSVKVSVVDHPPVMPEDLNAELSKLQIR